MSNFNKNQSALHRAQQAFSPQKEKASHSNDVHHSQQLENDSEIKKQEREDQQNDAGPRRYQGGDIYRKDHHAKKEKADGAL
ncbi:hypothetical protein ACIPEN_09645 [Herbaspirillum chlorophenolicum]|uniref:Uncharacterized protein n=1 Tax=Herbaspirillum chlorophenolicum TaxID=211589 RepID=A0ABW8EXS8_9BURK